MSQFVLPLASGIEGGQQFVELILDRLHLRRGGRVGDRLDQRRHAVGFEGTVLDVVGEVRALVVEAVELVAQFARGDQRVVHRDVRIKNRAAHKRSFASMRPPPGQLRQRHRPPVLGPRSPVHPHAVLARDKGCAEEQNLGVFIMAIILDRNSQFCSHEVMIAVGVMKVACAQVRAQAFV